MNPVRKPYALGTATQAPELAGRGEVLEAARIALERLKIGPPEQKYDEGGSPGAGSSRGRPCPEMSEEPPDRKPLPKLVSRLRRVRARTIALGALAIAVGHVIYHALRDHVFPDAY